MNALAGGREVIKHRVVIAENTAACAICGAIVARRADGTRKGMWEASAWREAWLHERFPVGAPPGTTTAAGGRDA